MLAFVVKACPSTQCTCDNDITRCAGLGCLARQRALKTKYVVLVSFLVFILNNYKCSSYPYFVKKVSFLKEGKRRTPICRNQIVIIILSVIKCNFGSFVYELN